MNGRLHPTTTERLLLPLTLLLLLACSSEPAGGLDGEVRFLPGSEPEFFFAEDVEEGVRDGMRTAFAAARAAWGEVGPIEFWVVGADEAAAAELADRYCARRVELGHLSTADCSADSHRREELLEWARRAAESRRTGQAFFDAGWNGGFQWGLHQFSSSLPPGLAGMEGVRIEDDQAVLLHEYFHAVQQSHVATLDWERRQELAGPVWWVEGAADYMAQVASERLREAGSLPSDPRHPDRPWSSSERMALKLRSGLELRARHPGLRIAEVDYGPEAHIAYDLGAWAVAWLCREAGPECLLETFYPQLDELGWKGAFEATFGFPADSFWTEFDAFLELPLEEQLTILPLRPAAGAR